MSDVFLMFGITLGVFVMFTAILFGVGIRRNNQRIEISMEEKQITSNN